eukprot:gene3762-3679_t
MAQYVYSMNRVSKTVPPKRQILKDISLSFFPGAKIGVLGLNGSGKSTLLKIMAGVDKEIEGEAIPMPGIKIGYLPQEPQLNNEHTVRESVEEAMGEVFAAKAKLEEVYAAYAEPDADFDALAAEQARLEAIIATAGTDSEHQLEIAADALRLPPWDAKVGLLSGGEKRRIALCRLLLKARIARFEELSDYEYQKRNETQEIFIPVAERLGTQVIEFKNVTKSFGDRMAFVDQHRDALSDEKTVWEDISGGLDMINIGKFTMASRAYAGRFNFNGGDQQKKVGDSQWTFFDGNYQEYEADKKKRLGEEGAKPKRMRFKALK